MINWIFNYRNFRLTKMHFGSFAFFFCSFLINLNRFNVRAEVFTALAELEELLQTESVLINALESFIQTHEQKLAILRRYAEAYQNQHDIAAADVQVYVSNPINAYLLVKRLTTDWKEVQTLIETNAGAGKMSKLI